MRPDLYKVLSTLFYEHDRVNIPGIGGFTLSYQSAELDQIKGELSPPSKQLQFNPNLVLDDGLLSGYLEQQFQLSSEQAERLIQDFTRQINQKLDQREIVELPGIGRLYRNYEQELKFLPDGQNFYASTFSLPTLEIQPVGTQERSSAAAETSVGKSNKSKTGSTFKASRPSLSYRLSGWLQRNLALIAILTIVIVLGGLYLLSRDPNPEKETEDSVPAERLNVSPSEGQSPAAIQPSEETVAPNVSESYAIIAVGLFSQSPNVRRLRDRLSAAGYEPYTETEEGATRVGVRLSFKEESELLEALQDIRNRFEKTAFIMIRDGERQND